MTQKIRRLPEVDERVETGAVQFGSDWPGLFVRGDDCIQLLMALDSVLEHCEMPYAMSLTTIREVIARHVLFGAVPGSETGSP